MVDTYGHCSTCGKNMLIEQVLDGKLEKRFTADYDEVQYLLDNGSRMRVVVCKQCKEKGKQDDTKEVMQTVINGWKKEVDDLVADPKRPDWTKERGDKHMKEYSSISIVTDKEKEFKGAKKESSGG